MDMSRNTVRPKGQCTQCGIEATHANECQMCHLTTLSVAVIKSVFHAEQLKSVTENLAEADLIADAKDTFAPGSVRRVAKTITRLAFANKIGVHDLQRKVVSRLRETCMAIENQTEQSKADYTARIMDWLGTLKTHFKTAKP